VNETGRPARRPATNTITGSNVAPASDGERAEFRGGPIATVRLLADAFVRPSSIWGQVRAELEGERLAESVSSAVEIEKKTSGSTEAA
jgi:hypothetical protein